MIVYYDAQTGQRKIVAGKDTELEAAGWVQVEPEPDEFLPVAPSKPKKATVKK